MSSLGRNFSFLQSPIPEHRLGRYKTGSTALPQGAPVLATGATDTADKRRAVALAAADAPMAGAVGGLGGILVWDEGWEGLYGLDSALNSASDVGLVPAYTAAQVVHGTEVRVGFRNTTAHSFLNLRNYTGLVMVNMTSLVLGDYLTPGAGDDTNGYWKRTTTAANGWLRVTGIDSNNGLVEAQMLF